jgi:cyclophilin family peptidyl-prolyl cis-trans isomerase
MSRGRATLFGRLLQLLVVFLAVLVARPAAADEDPPLGDEHIILRTVAGDMVLGLFPSVAPRTVEQLVKLVRAGVYDGTAFVRIEPNFVVQLSAHWDRTTPVTDAQKELIHKIPAEFSETVKHKRGSLSMAREDKDINSAETSFSVLLAPAPHLDGKYTIFGKLIAGEAVLEQMLRVPRGAANRPVVRLDVLRAEVVTKDQLAAARIAPERAVNVPKELAATAVGAASDPARAAAGATAGAIESGRTEIAVCVAFICFVGLASFFLQGKVPATVHGSLNLVIVLIGAFVLVIVLMPVGRRMPWLAAAMFFGLIGLFKVLGRFESPAVRK